MAPQHRSDNWRLWPSPEKLAEQLSKAGFLPRTRLRSKYLDPGSHEREGFLDSCQPHFGRQFSRLPISPEGRCRRRQREVPHMAGRRGKCHIWLIRS